MLYFRDSGFKTVISCSGHRKRLAKIKFHTSVEYCKLKEFTSTLPFCVYTSLEYHKYGFNYSMVKFRLEEFLAYLEGIDYENNGICKGYYRYYSRL